MSHFKCRGGGFAIFNGELRFSFVPPQQTWSKAAAGLYKSRMAEAHENLRRSKSGGYESLAVVSDGLKPDEWPRVVATKDDAHAGRSWPIDSREAAEIVACYLAVG